jgi:uncharacterized membrane protein YdfJ with MMPL/SSD domain
VGLRRYYRVAALIILGLVAGLAAAGCAAPQYTYVADSSDNAYFKVPPSWHQVSQSSLQSLTGQSSTLGNYLWTRAYDASPAPSADHILSSTSKPVVFASVISLSTSERSSLSLNSMRDLFLPVTSAARSAASQEGEQLTGFQSISDQVVTNNHGYRGIREIFDYTFNGVPETFDLTVLTDSTTTKLYFLLIQCWETCFASDYSQISQVVGSFTVGGGP